MKKIKGIRRISRYVMAMVCMLVITGIVSSERCYAAENHILAFRELSVDEIVQEMGTGLNLGNTLDGHTALTPSETLWQPFLTTQNYINKVHDAGFNTIRIPVTWGTMIDDTTYEIDVEWINRVQDVVDYAISQDMYVIINMHHDGAEGGIGWIELDSEDWDGVKNKYEAAWGNIADFFKDYDEHLIFESMNEVKSSTLSEKEDIARIMELNQLFVNVVRGTGSNNAKRWLSVPGRYTNIDTTTNPVNEFSLPQDTVENRLFVSVHDYPMGPGLTASMASSEYSETMAKNYASKIKKLYDMFTSKGIPVILGEYGVMDKDNLVDREYYFETMNEYCATAGIVPCVWECGGLELYGYDLFDRETGANQFPTIVAAMLRGISNKMQVIMVDNVVKGTKIETLTSATFDTDAMDMEIGEVSTISVNSITPKSSNDVLVWRTSDPYVATVSAGRVYARGIGTTTVYACSQNGEYEKSFTIKVNAESTTPCEVIQSVEQVDIKVGEFSNLSASNETSGSSAYLTYRSSDPSIATVNRMGKVVGIQEGECKITITASTGLTKEVPVNVSAAEVANSITISLNIYYASSYYAGNEEGQKVTINGDGTYTLTFDCARDLSEKAKTSGVLGIGDFGALYIKDSSGGYLLDACNIMYDKVVIDGQELQVTQTEPKSALKSGVFDTNDPINAWDGSQVEGVTENDFMINFDGLENPQTIEITFTLTDMYFTGADAPAGEATYVQYQEKQTMEQEELTEVLEEVANEPEVEENLTTEPEVQVVEEEETEVEEHESIHPFIMISVLFVLAVIVLSIVFVSDKSKKNKQNETIE